MHNATQEPFTVLLFEDSSTDAELAVRALRACGFPVHVEVARDGEEALQVLGLMGSPEKGLEDIPDLILSDLKMPKVSGDEILARTRKDHRFSEVPFIVFSSSDEQIDVSRCMSLGADAFCVKPIDYSSYKACMAEITKRWLIGTDKKQKPSCAVKIAQGA